MPKPCDWGVGFLEVWTTLPSVTFLIWSAIFVAPLYCFYFYPSVVLTNLKTATAWVVGYFIGATLAAGALAALVKYSSPVLRAVLDVDTYLRTSPIDATPRAKIVERYVSLLRYLVRYRDPVDGRGYDSVVIVAHSLGSLISADLLRFLHAEGDDALAPLGLAGEFEQRQGGISLKLLTMGNPTRQLLNRFFPYLYDWVRENPAGRHSASCYSSRYFARYSASNHRPRRFTRSSGTRAHGVGKRLSKRGLRRQVVVVNRVVPSNDRRRQCGWISRTALCC